MGGWSWSAAVLAVASCGRVGFSATGDGAGSGGSDGTVPADAAPCATPGPWMTPTRLAVNTASNDWSPALSGDTLRLVFQSDRGGDNDLYEATRATTADAFGSVVPLTALNGSSSERAPTLTTDGLTIYFDSDRSGTHELYRATRTSVTSAFAAPQMVPVAGATEVVGPEVSAAGDELFYNDAAEVTIYRATIVGTTITLVGAVSGLGNASYPSLSRDGLTMYFTSNSSSAPLIYATTRLSIGAAFGAPVPVANLTTGMAQEDPELGKDARTLVFAADDTDGTMANIYLTTRVCM
jgi:Tol biopolymer transport system component